MRTVTLGITVAVLISAGCKSEPGKGMMNPGTCEPSVPCYDGPEGTNGVGACMGGTRQCNADGSPGACVGQVVPRLEQCGSGVDADCDGTAAPACAPVAGHPRLWITAADLPRLRDWANPNRSPRNAVWNDGLAKLIEKAELEYQKAFPNGTNGPPNPTFPDDGGSGVGGYYVEAYAQLYAFLSLVAPEQAMRDEYGVRARNLLMYAIERAASCPAQQSPPTPYCDPIMAIYNRANYDGEAWGLTVDWAYPYFSQADKALLHKVFVRWSDEVYHSWVAPLPDAKGLALLSNEYFNGNRQFRASMNNYFIGTTRNSLLEALSLDPEDDPDGALKAYVDRYFAVTMYMHYAMMQEPEQTKIDYGIGPGDLASIDRLGMARGGIPVEGSLYGHSLGYLMEALLALHTAGLDDVGTRGPQAALVTLPYWDQFIVGFLSSLMPKPFQPAEPFAFMPEVYQHATFGDLLYSYVSDFDHFPELGAIGALDQRAANKPARLETIRWLLNNAFPGGSSNFHRLIAESFTNSYASAAILLFLTLDPDVALPTPAEDPRPALPTTFYAPAVGRLLAHTDWSDSGNLFTHICDWASINHEPGTCGQFELYRNGEWLTKERSGYDNGKYPAAAYGYTPDNHNVLGIQNDYTNVNPATLRNDELGIYERGGMWNNDAGAGDPSTRASWGSSFAYTWDDATNLYNRVGNKTDMTKDSALAVTKAVRSTLWLKPDHIVVYDRATTTKPDLFKRFNLVLDQATDANRNPIQPTVTPMQYPVVGGTTTTGNLITETTPKGQLLFVNAVLPATQKVSLNVVDPLYPVAILEPSQFGPIVGGVPGESGWHLQIDDDAKPADTRFLTVLQGADALAPNDPVHLITSTSGTSFEGVAIEKAGTSSYRVVVFMRDDVDLATFATTTFSIPLGTIETFICDLAPNTTYALEAEGGVVKLSKLPLGPGNVLTITSDDAGVVRF